MLPHAKQPDSGEAFTHYPTPGVESVLLRRSSCCLTRSRSSLYPDACNADEMTAEDDFVKEVNALDAEMINDMNVEVPHLQRDGTVTG